MSDYHPPLRRTPSKSFEALRPRTITPLDTPAIRMPVETSLLFPLTSEELRARVKQAARTVCAGEVTFDCQKSAVADAEPQVALALANTMSPSGTASIAVSAH